MWLNFQQPRGRVILSIWVARFIPIVLVFIAGFATYIMIGLLSRMFWPEILTTMTDANIVDYLLAKKHATKTAISIIVTYSILVTLLTMSFFRLTYITYFDPPYVPLGKGYTKEAVNTGTGEYYSGKEDAVLSGLDDFYKKNVFVADHTGKPCWCSPCANWKPDRAHHCSRSGRCIRKMDHFCPWVGGPVGENNFKFFIQFTTYGALYCSYVLIVLTIIVLEQKKNEGDHVQTMFLVMIGLASSFLLFSGGMALGSIRIALKNLTQVEFRGAKKRVYTLAINLPQRENLNVINAPDSYLNYPIISYPVETSDEFLTWQRSSLRSSVFKKNSNQYENSLRYTADQNQNFTQSNDTDNLQFVESPSNSQLKEHSVNIAGQRADTGHRPPSIKTLDRADSGTPECVQQVAGTCQKSDSQETLANSSRQQTLYRTFVIARTNPGENPWDLGSCFLNWKTVMGENVLDWFLPVRQSPCCYHDDAESQFKIGPVIDNLCVKLGLLISENVQNEKT